MTKGLTKSQSSPLSYKPRSDEEGESDDEIEQGFTAREVICVEDKPEWSGLLDAQGRKLYRVVEKVPFGFQVAKK